MVSPQSIEAVRRALATLLGTAPNRENEHASALASSAAAGESSDASLPSLPESDVAMRGGSR
jgi:hypothetical protein